MIDTYKLERNRDRFLEIIDDIRNKSEFETELETFMSEFIRNRQYNMLISRMMWHSDNFQYYYHENNILVLNVDGSIMLQSSNEDIPLYYKRLHPWIIFVIKSKEDIIIKNRYLYSLTEYKNLFYMFKKDYECLNNSGKKVCKQFTYGLYKLDLTLCNYLRQDEEFINTIREIYDACFFNRGY